MGTDQRSRIFFLATRLLTACLVIVTLGSREAWGENCGGFAGACSSSNDYCTNILTGGTCKEKGDAGDSCDIIATCKSGLVCDVLGECRHSPPQEGELCGTGVPCASGLTCSKDVAGRCEAPGQSGDACSGVGQGSCASGLVCDANRTCRHDPPREGEPCGTGVSCASGFVCSSAAGGTCQAQGDAGDGCNLLVADSCKSGLVCDAATSECRHSPPLSGEVCNDLVPCASGLFCSSAVGTCQEPGDAGDACNLLAANSCKSGLVCDASSVCRHDPPERGEPCGTGVSCAGALVCSADIAGTCGDRGGAGDGCSGTGQGSCEAGLVCDLLRVCRHDPPRLNEPCGIGVACDDGLFCQGGTQVCKKYKTVGEGCSAFNPCMEGLACDPCFTAGCNYPLQCFPNPNDGAIDRQTCLTIYSPDQHQVARDAGVAMTWAAGDAAAAGVGESQEFGVVYGPGGDYGCFTTVCAGVSVDVSISAFVSVGFYETFDVVAGSSTAVIEGVGAGVASFSTSQIYARNSLDPFDIVGFPDAPIGTEDVLAVTVSPDDVVIPFNPGTFACETVVDPVIGGAGQPTGALCGDGFVDDGEACDDGNLSDGDGCSSGCTDEALCGNGTVDTGEGCDDGNTAGGDGCSSQCQVEPRCGDGNLDLGEECDDGNTVSGDGCSETCTIQTNCPDGTVDPTGQCNADNGGDGGDGGVGDGAGDGGGGSSSGGCTASRDAGFDPVLPLLLLGPVATLWLRRRIRSRGACRSCDRVGDGGIPVCAAPRGMLMRTGTGRATE